MFVRRESISVISQVKVFRSRWLINYNPSRPVLSGSGSGTNITMTTEYPHGLTVGDTVKVSGAEEISTHTPSSATYNPVTGMFVITRMDMDLKLVKKSLLQKNQSLSDVH